MIKITLLILVLATACSIVIGSAAALTNNTIIYSKTIKIDNQWDANLVIHQGDEPVDVIFSALRPYGVDFAARRNIFQEVKRAGIPYSREYAQLLSQNIVLEDDDSFSGTFTYEDNGSEPVDVIHNFAKKHSIESHFKGLSNALLPKLCELVTCIRHRPRIWYNEITSNNTSLGDLEILEGDEAVDTVDAFVQNLSVDVIGDRIVFRRNLLNTICKSIVCSREIPVVYRKYIKGEDGKNNGAIEVYEDEEVIDAVVRYIRKSNVSLDEIALKNAILQQACGISLVKCTRNVGVVFRQRITSHEDGSVINTLTIYENEEPADKVYQFCQENNINIRLLDSILSTVCDSELVICYRRDAVYFSTAISGPDGDYVNTLELKVGHEPVDDIYKFFASNNLFKKGWQFHGIVTQICAKPNVDCRRHKAVKYFQPQFTMGGVEMGKVVIWEDEEVVDVLYHLRQMNNVTLDDQIAKFNEICKDPEVACERNRAVIFRKTEITKLDYEKFGNETCNRQFVGVKFRSAFHNLPFGSTIVEFLKNETVTSMFEHPLCCVYILGILLLCTSIPRRLKPHHKIAISLWLILVVSILQSLMVEPDERVDKAMHVYEGKLPDLEILENEEPVDALLRWSKLAAKEHLDAKDYQSIVRQPIYLEILEELCGDQSKTTSLTCTRTRAHEFLSMGAMTFFGKEYPIEFYNPDVDPIARKTCTETMDGKSNTCIDKSATQICERFQPPPANCVRDIALHIATQLETTDSKRFDEKCSYKRLSLEMDAPGRELYPKSAGAVRERMMNMSPFARVDNGTVAHRWSSETSEAFTAIDTFQKIRDPESREWNDKPCTPYFNGAMCAKQDKDGNLMIEV